jgi:hypothetical protein
MAWAKVYIEIDGNKYSLRDAAEVFNINYGCLRRRYYDGLRGDKLVRPISTNPSDPTYRNLNKLVSGIHKHVTCADNPKTELARLVPYIKEYLNNT